MPDMQNMNLENMDPEQLKKLAAEMQRKEEEGLSPEEKEERRRKKEAEKQKNIALLNETLDLCHKGSYEKDGQTISLGLTEAELCEAKVFLPDEIRDLSGEQSDQGASDTTPVRTADQSTPDTTSAETTDQGASAVEGQLRCVCSCENQDALSLAHEKSQDPAYANDDNGRELVLNLASAARPGGAIREGANGQEEDLCRKSTLLLSLESDEAKRYYDYNNALNTHMGSDAVVITPNVAVVRDNTGELLDQPYWLSVMSCSAPMVRLGLEGKSEEEYRDMLYVRISGMLRCAASLGYKNLVLGAFGCGVFGNDAAVVSDAFYKAFSGPVGASFAHVDFAVLCTEGKEYNYQEFCRNFGN